jgi:hypothetical protein
MAENADPLVTAYVERDEAHGHWVLTVQCPHCGDVHTHGGGRLDGPPSLGHRVSHCVHADSSGYVLVAGSADMPKPKPLSSPERRKRLLAYDRQRGITPTGRITFYGRVGS